MFFINLLAKSKQMTTNASPAVAPRNIDTVFPIFPHDEEEDEDDGDDDLVGTPFG